MDELALLTARAAVLQVKQAGLANIAEQVGPALRTGGKAVGSWLKNLFRPASAVGGELADARVYTPEFASRMAVAQGADRSNSANWFQFQDRMRKWMFDNPGKRQNEFPDIRGLEGWHEHMQHGPSLSQETRAQATHEFQNLRSSLANRHLAAQAGVGTAAAGGLGYGSWRLGGLIHPAQAEPPIPNDQSPAVHS